jgi:hypothetical protein
MGDTEFVPTLTIEGNGASVVVVNDGRLYAKLPRSFNLSINELILGVQELIALIPAVWDWAIQSRKLQDEIVSVLESMIGSKILLTEKERCSIDADLIIRVDQELQRYKEMGQQVVVPDSGCFPGGVELLTALNDFWNTPEGQERVEKYRVWKSQTQEGRMDLAIKARQKREREILQEMYRSAVKDELNKIFPAAE